MECKQCHIEKELNEDNFYKSTSKFGWDKTCKVCRKKNVDTKNKINKKYPGYRKVKDLINPTHPIPLKLTSQDGFGGYYRFDFEKLKNDLSFAKSNGQKNHMVKRSTRCWQVKDTDEISMMVFCDYIGMSREAIIKFDKIDHSMYVVNLYHPRILEVMQ
jgi:hypothetical protein